MERRPGLVCFSWKFSSKWREEQLVPKSDRKTLEGRLWYSETVLLTLEFFPIDRFAAGPIASGKVASLQHEFRDDSVER
jgi:hypothetical protein